jgi:hypothetical protein
MTNDEYDKVELAALTQLGWTYLHGAQLAPAFQSENGEREYLREVVLEKRLKAALLRINPALAYFPALRSLLYFHQKSISYFLAALPIYCLEPSVRA